MATHSSVLAWRIPGMVEPGGCRLWGRTELDTTKVTQQQQQQQYNITARILTSICYPCCCPCFTVCVCVCVCVCIQFSAVLSLSMFMYLNCSQGMEEFCHHNDSLCWPFCNNTVFFLYLPSSIPKPWQALSCSPFLKQCFSVFFSKIFTVLCFTI